MTAVQIGGDACAKVQDVGDACAKVQDVGDACAKVQDVVDELGTVRQSPPDADGVASFNYLYTQITKGILARLQNGGFSDPGFLSELDVQFARRYFDALGSYQQNPASCPRSWRVLFDRQHDPRITRMQFAIAGVNAHVNFDLALALVATWDPADAPESTSPQHDDYETINKVFHDEMANLRHDFEDPLLQKLDESAVERLSNQFDDMLVVIFRNAAWHTGEHLWRLNRKSEKEFKLKAEAMDVMTALAGQALLAPVDIAERA
jgi:hypothetical protein